MMNSVRWQFLNEKWEEGSLWLEQQKKYKFAISFSILECLHMLLNKTPAELSTKEYKFELRGTARKLKF